MTSRSSAPKPQPYDYFCVLDFEATCVAQSRSASGFQPEVIEFPSVLLEARTMCAVDEFQTYVRPVINPTVSAFCTELTGIQQHWVDTAPPFVDALSQHTAWLRQHGLEVGGARGHSVVCVTCGDWDLKTMLPGQLRLLGDLSGGPSRVAVPDHLRRWVNIKMIYHQCVPQGRRSKASDMTGMLRGLGLKLEGKHHSGIDDCRNIASIVRALAQRGATLECTTSVADGSDSEAARANTRKSSQRKPKRRANKRSKAKMRKGR